MAMQPQRAQSTVHVSPEKNVFQFVLACVQQKHARVEGRRTDIHEQVRPRSSLRRTCICRNPCGNFWDYIQHVAGDSSWLEATHARGVHGPYHAREVGRPLLDGKLPACERRYEECFLN